MIDFITTTNTQVDLLNTFDINLVWDNFTLSQEDTTKELPLENEINNFNSEELKKNISEVRLIAWLIIWKIRNDFSNNFLYIGSNKEINETKNKILELLDLSIENFDKNTYIDISNDELYLLICNLTFLNISNYFLNNQIYKEEFLKKSKEFLLNI